MRADTLTIILAFHIAVGFCCNSPSFYNKKYSGHRNWKLLPIGKCGERNSFQGNPASFIVGGKPAEIGQYPWMALIHSFNRNGDRIRCGGSIINNKYILTAAHCIFPGQKLTVTVGETSQLASMRCRDDACSCADELSALPLHRSCAEEMVIHPRYKSRPDGYHEENDIALVRLSDPIPHYKGNEANYIGPICLPAFAENRKFLEEKLLEVAGWGKLDPDGPLRSTLETFKVPVVSQKNCENIWNNALIKNKLCPTARQDCLKNITNQFICSSGIKGLGICMGDSGVPLMAQVPLSEKEKTSVMFVVGVASHIMGKNSFVGDCGSGVPDVFTRVSEYVTWILDNIRE